MAVTTTIEDLGLRQVGSELRHVQMIRTTGYTETRNFGKHGEYQLKEQSVTDYGSGSAGGKTVVRSWTPARAASEEEKARNLANIGRAATKAMNRRGIEGNFKVYVGSTEKVKKGAKD